MSSLAGYYKIIEVIIGRYFSAQISIHFLAIKVNAPTVFLIRITSVALFEIRLPNSHHILCNISSGNIINFDKKLGIFGNRPILACAVRTEYLLCGFILIILNPPSCNEL